MVTLLERSLDHGCLRDFPQAFLLATKRHDHHADVAERRLVLVDLHIDLTFLPGELAPSQGNVVAQAARAEAREELVFFLIFSRLGPEFRKGFEAAEHDRFPTVNVDLGCFHAHELDVDHPVQDSIFPRSLGDMDIEGIGNVCHSSCKTIGWWPCFIHRVAKEEKLTAWAWKK